MDNSKARKAAQKRSWYLRNRAHCLAYAQKYREKNLDKVKARETAYNQANKERKAVWSKSYQQYKKPEYIEYMKTWRIKNKERIAESKRIYNEAHKEQNRIAKAEWDAKNKAHVNAYAKKYVEANRAAVNLRTQKRKALKRDATIGEVDVSLLLENMICGICDQEIIGDYHIDHIIPLSKGGAHAQHNLQLVHPSCNVRKYNKILPTKKTPKGLSW